MTAAAFPTVSQETTCFAPSSWAARWRALRPDVRFHHFWRRRAPRHCRWLARRQAIQEGIFPWILGVVLHYFIAISAAAFTASRAASSSSSRPLAGLRHLLRNCDLPGMNLIVLPLCAYHFTGLISSGACCRACWCICSSLDCRSRSAFTSCHARTFSERG